MSNDKHQEPGDNSTDKAVKNNLLQVADQIDDILLDHDLAGYFVLAAPDGGIQRFTFPEWAGLDWDLDSNGIPMVKIAIAKEELKNNPDSAINKSFNCCMLSYFFFTSLRNQAGVIEAAAQEICAAFGIEVDDVMEFINKHSDTIN